MANEYFKSEQSNANQVSSPPPQPQSNKKRKGLIFLAAIIVFVGLCLGLYFGTKLDIFLIIMIIVLFLLFPALIIYLCSKIKFLNKLGVVLLCYLCGIIVGNIGILPEAFTGSVQSTMQDISVCIALPLLLFSLNVKKWVKMAKSGLLCMLMAILSIVIVTFVLFLIFGMSDKAAQLSGLATGVYTGGTPNIAAIYKGIGVSTNDYILFNTYDTVLSILYIIFLTSIARTILLKVFRMRPYKSPENKTTNSLDESAFDESINAYSGIFKKDVLPQLIGCFVLAAAILGVAYVVGDFFGSYATAVTILLITTGGIAFSFIKKIRETKKTFQLGMYIIYVFCFTVASMADVSALINIDWIIFAYVAIAIFGSLTLHAILCKLIKIDTDTMIIVSTSAICSPPFVPVVANGLKNRDVLITGLITGIIGYAIGNYIGIGIYYLYTLFI
jgi:uncharacterized membrane protein